MKKLKNTESAQLCHRVPVAAFLQVDGHGLGGVLPHVWLRDHGLAAVGHEKFSLPEEEEDFFSLALVWLDPFHPDCKVNRFFFFEKFQIQFEKFSSGLNS